MLDILCMNVRHIVHEYCESKLWHRLHPILNFHTLCSVLFYPSQLDNPVLELEETYSGLMGLKYYASKVTKYHSVQILVRQVHCCCISQSVVSKEDIFIWQEIQLLLDKGRSLNCYRSALSSVLGPIDGDNSCHSLVHRILKGLKFNFGYLRQKHSL